MNVYCERADKKRKSWVSSERSMSVGSGVARMVESSSTSAIIVDCGGEGTKSTLGNRSSKLNFPSFNTIPKMILTKRYGNLEDVLLYLQLSRLINGVQHAALILSIRLRSHTQSPNRSCESWTEQPRDLNDAHSRFLQ